jgi:8-oxo-dGTP diphosphatase
MLFDSPYVVHQLRIISISFDQVRRVQYLLEPSKPNLARRNHVLALFDSGGNILLLRRKDNDKWTMPGGTLDFGESLTDCAGREVREETGLQIRITGLIGTYTDPHILITYSDGEARQEFTFVYAAEIESGALKIDDESKEAAWVPLSSAVELPLAESQRRRLKDVLEYQKKRHTFLR